MPECADDLPLEVVLQTLEKVRKSRAFADAPSLGKLLEFCVEETHAKRKLTQTSIAEKLEYRKFDALINSGVRREMQRLREKLRDYYGLEGRSDAVIISIPKATKTCGYSVKFLVVQPDSENPRYHQLTSEARHLWSSRAPNAIAEAIGLYKEAIREDLAHSVSAHAGLSHCYAFLSLCGFPAHETMPQAKEWALKTIALDSENAIANAVLAFVTSAYDWDWQVADQLFKRALDLAPHSIEVRCWYASQHVCMGRLPDAIKQAQKAQTLEHDPTPVVLSHIGKILFVAGDLNHAFDLLKFTVEINPHFYFSHYYLGMVLVHRGDLDVGLEHLRQAAELAPEDPSVIAGIGYSLGLAGRPSEGFEYVAALERISKVRYVPSTDFATVYSGLGEFDEAFTALESAFQEKCLFLSWLHVWPPFQLLWSDSRLAEMVHRLGLDDSRVRLPVEQRFLR